MAIKQSNHIIKGLRQDYSPSKASSEYAVDAMNIRLTANDKNSLLSITCEKNPDKIIKLDFLNDKRIELGTLLGYTNINNNLLLFLKVTGIKYKKDFDFFIGETDGNKGSYYEKNAKEVLFEYIKEYEEHNRGEEYDKTKYIYHARISLFLRILQNSLSNLYSLDSSLKDNSNVKLIIDYIQDICTIMYYYYWDNYNNSNTPEADIKLKYPNISFNPKKEHIDVYYNNNIIENLQEILNSQSKILMDAIVKVDTTIKEYDILYTGNLGFPEEGTIDCLASYENEEVQKVYWVDGVNQPRVINIAATDEQRETWDDKSFDFIPTLKLNEYFHITKVRNIYGSFSPGTIQYCFNYYDSNGRETNIVDISPLLYVNDLNKGNKPDEAVVSCAFKIIFQDLDDKFSNIKIYAVQRTSFNGTPSVRSINKKIIDYKSFTFIDNGLEGEYVDPTELFYKGGESIIPKTIAQKDNTLFLGNIKLAASQTDNFLHAKKLLTNVDNYSTSWDRLGSSEDIGITIDNDLFLQSHTEDLITTAGFKFRETYRFGVQLQDTTGKWTTVIPILDSKNEVSSPFLKTVEYSTGKKCYLYTPKFKLSIDSIKNELISLGYKKIRPVVVLPNDNNREVVAQGIVNSTIYNINQRNKGTSQAQSSWFFRPIQGNKGRFVSYPRQKIVGVSSDNSTTFGTINTAKNSNYFPSDLDIYKRGYPVAYRNDEILPPSYCINAEFPHMWYDTKIFKESISNSAWIKGTLGATSNIVSTIEESHLPIWDVDYYAVDRSICTFHSPEIEFGTVHNLNNCKCRIVGYVLYGHSVRARELQQKGSYFSIDNSVSNKDTYSSGFPDHTSYIGLQVPVEYIGDIERYTYIPLYGVYPWNKDNYYNADYKLKVNKISHLHIYTNTIYGPGLATDSTTSFNPVNLDLADAKIFNGSVDSIVLKAPKNAVWYKNAKSNFIYKGNVNDLLTSFNLNEEILGYWLDLANYAPAYISATYDGYPIMGQGKDKNTSSSIGKGAPFPMTEDFEVNNNGAIQSNKFLRSKSAISLTYKSSPHGVFVIEHKSTSQGYSQKVYFPNFDETQEPSNDSRNIKKYHPDGMLASNYNEPLSWNTPEDHRGYLPICEFYRDINPTEKFGDINNDVNIWNIAGKAVSLTAQDCTLVYTDGDTFFTQYDCLKTYPRNNNDFNQVTEIGSFFLETRVNTATRYDNNKNSISNLHVSPTNFNLYNDVYSQTNNFFTDRVLEDDILDNKIFPHTITWTKTKQSNMEIDPWTNITMAATLDLDGIDGELVKLYTYNNELYSFQTKSMNHILYNSRVQIKPSDGIPIDLANSSKVDGARKLSNVGCSNIDAVKDNNMYIYFVDAITKNIYRSNGSQVESLSDKLNFCTWSNNNINKESKVYVDHTDKNVYIQVFDKAKGKRLSLGYSELLGEFESFYSYNSPIIKSDTSTLMLENSNAYINIYELYPNNINRSTLSDLEESYITILSNGGSLTDKVFTTLDSTVEDNSTDTNIQKPFTNVEITTGNISTSKELTYGRHGSSDLKKRFNIWRMNLPRLNRQWFRYPWAKIKLTLNRNSNPEIHNLAVNYLE